nr:DNA polymerase III subunit tau [Klebsiella pneumoniae]
MSYQVLARKWRPQTFADVVGREHVLTALANGLSLGRIHHAYLFRYPRGRKTSIARLLAKGLNCETGITATPAACAITAGKLNRGALSI